MAAGFKLLLCLLLFQQHVSALQVTTGSSCEALCRADTEGDRSLDAAPSPTSSSDIICEDSKYSNTKAGIRFKKCADCLQQSRASRGEDADVRWLLYNLRYSVNVCLYGFSNATTPVSSPCDIDYACQPLKQALQVGDLNPKNGSQLDYCDADEGRFTEPSIGYCVQCLRSTEDQVYTANFLVALKAGCQQRPKPGDLIGLSGSLFTAHQVNITAPPKNETGPATEDSPTAMTTGAVVGIGVGAGLLFLGGTALFVVYYRKQKKQLHNGYRRQSGSYSMTPPPIPAAYGPYDSRGASAMGHYTLNTQAAYGSNAEYYGHMEKEMHSQPANFNFDPNQASRGPNSALPTHPAYIPHSLGPAASRESSLPPPQPIRSSKPDIYAMNTYPNMVPVSVTPAEMVQRPAVSAPPPPPGPPPPAMTRGMSVSSNSSQPLLPRLAPPPPPPPRAPRLSLPSVRKLRVPRKYSPPRIIAEEPTPTTGHGEVPICIQITGPLVQHHQRYSDETTVGSSFGTGVSFPAGGQGEIRQQQAVDRRQRADFGDMVEIHTGKSTMYG